MEFGKPWFVKETEKAFGLCFVILGRRRDRRRLYSKVNPANLNLRPDVDESSTEDTRSIRFDVNEEWIEKEVDEVTKPSPNERLLRHLKVLRRTPNMTRRRQPLPDQSISWNRLSLMKRLRLKHSGPNSRIVCDTIVGTEAPNWSNFVTRWIKIWPTSCWIIGRKWPNQLEEKTKKVQELKREIPKSCATADEQPHEAPRKPTDGRIKEMENTEKEVDEIRNEMAELKT